MSAGTTEPIGEGTTTFYELIICGIPVMRQTHTVSMENGDGRQFVFPCQNCNRPYAVPKARLGQIVQCPACGERNRVPKVGSSYELILFGIPVVRRTHTVR